MRRSLSILLLLALVFSPVSPVVPKAEASILTAYQAHTNTYGWDKPYVAFVGDSIVAGYTNFTTQIEGGPSGLIDGDVADWFRRQTGARGTNFGFSGAAMPFIQNVVTGSAIPIKPKKILVQGGINNLQSGDTWSTVLANWNAIQAACVQSNIQLVASEVWPSTLASWAAISNYNLSLRNWCLASNVPCIRAYAWMADPVLQTNIYSSYTWDNVHPTTNGTRRWSEIVVNKFNAIEGEPSTYNTHDASWYAVQAANLATTNRDTINIPAGAADWTSQLLITNGLTLQGQGTNSTIVSNGMSNASVDNNLLVFSTPANETNRMTGIQFTKGSVTNHAAALFRVLGSYSDNRRIRIDHCLFYHVGFPEGQVWLFYSALGVFDHNTIVTEGSPAWGGYVKCNDVGDYSSGDGTWMTNEQFGTDQFMFFEDNVFTNKYTLSHITIADGQAGARFVFRNNTIYKGSFESHGLEASRERSGRAFEIYNNTFNGIDTQENIIYFRGGVGLVYSNYVYGYGSPKLYLLNNRLSDSIAAPFGGADGRNPWDSNSLSSPFVTGTASSAGALTVTDSGKAWTVNQWAGYTVRKTGGSGTVKAVSSATRSGSTVTVNCTSHGFTNGQYVSLFNCAQQAYNTIYLLQPGAVVNANQFTVVNDWQPTSPATVGGSGTSIYATAGNHFSEIRANTSTQLTFKDSVYYGYGDARDGIRMSFASGDTYEINLVVDAMDQPGMGAGAGPYVSGDAPVAIPAGWPSQTPSPWYEWQNINCTSGPAVIGAAGTDFDFSPIPLKVIEENRHYVNDTVKPGYTPYVYPHPMVSGVEPIPPADLPAAPGVQKIGGISLKACLGPLFAVFLWRVCRRRR